MLRLAFRHKLIDGDALLLQYRPDRLGPGRGRYATTVQVVDPDRLSNPQQNFDMPNIRGGVEIDEDGAPVAYHIREAHIGDWWSGAKTMTWRRIPRETSWGRPHVVHDFDHERGAQHRGNGILTPVVQRLKMLVKYDQSELEAAILNAILPPISSHLMTRKWFRQRWEKILMTPVLGLIRTAALNFTMIVD